MFRNLFFWLFSLFLPPLLAAQSLSPDVPAVDETLAALDRRGLDISLQLYSDALVGSPANPSAPHATAFQFLDLSGDVDLGRLTDSMRHTRLYTSFHVNGGSGADFDGACQAMVGITSPPGARLAELWLEHDFGYGVRVRAGKIDANPDFAIVNNGSGFLNSSFSYDPAFFTLPNYSSTAWGTELFLQHRYVHLNVAAFDPTQGSGTLLIEEAGVDWNPVGRNGRVAVGSWQQTGKLTSLSGFEEKGARGYYAVAEQKFWRRVRNAGKAEQSLSGFLQLGSAPSPFSTIVGHLGAGVVLSSPFAVRASDSVGVSVTRGRLARDIAAPTTHGQNETIFEIYYRLELNSHLAVSPDLQYVKHPGGASSKHDAVAVGARIVFNLKPPSE